MSDFHLLIGARPDPFELVIPVATFLAALGVLIFIVVIVQKWYRREDDEVSAHNVLTAYRTMRDEGELTDEEYRKITRSLPGQIAATTRTNVSSQQGPTAGSPLNSPGEDRLPPHPLSEPFPDEDLSADE